ncbi:MAG: hypothetical protein ABIP20_20930 [Chthoniobacteraceae bacterium]
MPAIHRRSRRNILFWCIALAIAGTVGGIVARPYAAAAYHRWNARCHVAQASAALARGDHRGALLAARDALRDRPLDADATRIFAKSLEAMGAPEALEWRAKLATLLPGDPENTLAQATAALKTGGAAAAEQFLGSLDAAGRGSAGYHAMAAAIALKRNDAAGTESHFAEAARLEPGDKSHRLNLASVRLESKLPGVREAALDALREMRGNPATSLEALRMLLADAIRRREAETARDLADALVADQRCIFADKLTRLSTLRMIHDARSTPYLLELRDAAVSEPVELSTLLLWMNANELSLMVAEWVRWMPQEMISRPPVCLGVSETYVHTADWQKLEDLTTMAKWGQHDFMRRAFLALALEHLDEEEDAAKEWKEAVSAARGRADLTEHLAKFALQAKWTKRADEIMWDLAGLPQCPRWVLDSLWQDAYQRGATEKLHRLSREFAKADPKGIASRNNYAFLSLLTRSGDGNPNEIATSLHREHPENGMIASTYALSLHQKGRSGEAAAIMAALSAEELRQPQVALYQAIFLLASGQPEKAKDYLKLSADWPMLAEEAALLGKAKADSIKFAESAVRTTDPAVPGTAR